MNIRVRIVLFLSALGINLALILLVPAIHAFLRQDEVKAALNKDVEREIVYTPPERQEMDKREIKEIKTVEPRQRPESAPRPMSVGGLKLDLSPAGGSGPALAQGSGSSGTIGSGSGPGVMTYDMGATDTDAQLVNRPGDPQVPPRARREGVGGRVDLLFVVNERGFVEELQVLEENPKGYGFVGEALKYARNLRFRPATLQNVPVRQRFKLPIIFEVN